MTVAGLDGLGIVSVAAALALRRRPGTEPGSTSWLGEPGFWLAGVVAAFVVNQVLFTAYVIRVHGGDPSFIAHYLPSGWFALAGHNAVITSLANAVPHPMLLAPTVLRVQAFLELPLVILAYLTVARWFDARLYRRLLDRPTLWSAAIAYTAAFMLIEAHFWNPYTVDDLWVRAVSCAVTASLLGGPFRRISGAPAASGLPAFFVSAVALGGLVLVVYDTVLLYSLGRARADAPIALACGALLIGARLMAHRTRPACAGSHIGLLRAAIGEWLALFFVCALPVRYLLGFGTPWLAAVLGIAVVAVAAISVPHRGMVVASAVAVGLGFIAGGVAVLLPVHYPEAKLLLATGLFLAVVAGVLHRYDRGFRSVPPFSGTAGETRSDQ